MERSRVGEYIQTMSGRFYFEDPRESDVSIEDIAHALSHICRFAGHTTRFYSLAQHSVLVSRALPIPEDIALQGLLHDATEAYMVDLPRPLKRMLPAYQRLENDIWKVIARRFRLPEELSPEVKLADNKMLVTEARNILVEHPGNAWWREPHWPAPYKMSIPEWTPEEAKQHFLNDFRYLMEGRKPL